MCDYCHSCSNFIVYLSPLDCAFMTTAIIKQLVTFFWSENGLVSSSTSSSSSCLTYNHDTRLVSLLSQSRAAASCQSAFISSICSVRLISSFCLFSPLLFPFLPNPPQLYQMLSNGSLAILKTIRLKCFLMLSKFACLCHAFHQILILQMNFNFLKLQQK